ncbi:NADP-dependent oxidoreductase [Georgenia ruanii]|uniref:Zinc-binding dehydrogenase n=1 Tax=Georgenia ruanii TaxID=348442 RepID=A0A7J9UXN1_9MICO|nr:NADP-dependent oxidoreductase [Georgenia ruanii]MPV89377.1 zinc-binding dehydrogenase [Georgenia ruanii]
MKAAAIQSFDGPDALEITELDAPPLGPDTLLVEMAAASINPVDWQILHGRLRGAFYHHLPVVPGWDVAGTVVAVGPAVRGVAPGDRVAAYARKDHIQDGTFAEVVSVSERSWAHIPDGVPFDVAACVPLAGMTADMTLDAAQVGAGDTVLVHAAAGGVGSFAVQLARLRGATVIGTASPRNHDYLAGLGATPVAYGEGLVENVRAAAPDGVDAVIDLVGGEALDATDRLLRAGGRVASVLDPSVKDRFGGAYVFVHADRERLARLLGLVADGRLRVEIAERFPLDQARRALQLSEGRHVRGKLVLLR